MIESRCGLLCSQCEYRQATGCPGCVNMDKPFWGESCPVKSCCEGRGLPHCGACPEFPCPLLHQFAHDEKQGDGGRRIRQCRAWEGGAPRYACTLLAVRDMERSLAFYRTLFGQEVAMDLGANKTLTCGIVLQAEFDRLAGFEAGRMVFPSHNMELYFETGDLDAFLALLEGHREVQRLHEVETFPWLQRGIRIYDPDGHIIEVGESMYSVACRQFRRGFDVDETARRIQHPRAVVEQWYGQIGRAHV